MFVFLAVCEKSCNLDRKVRRSQHMLSIRRLKSLSVCVCGVCACGVCARVCVFVCMSVCERVRSVSECVFAHVCARCVCVCE